MGRENPDRDQEGVATCAAHHESTVLRGSRTLKPQDGVGLRSRFVLTLGPDRRRPRPETARRRVLSQTAGPDHQTPPGNAMAAKAQEIEVPILPWIIGDMPRDLGPIEIGFLTIIAFAAIAGT